MPISEKERQQINTLVARFETHTGIQAVAAVTGKADAYPEIPWKAYAMGSALGALLAAFAPPFGSEWRHASLIALDAMLILAAGAALAAAAALVPAVGRLFLDGARARAEARQYAQSLFLERELFATSERRSVLILLCRFERLAVVMTDAGLAQHATSARLAEVGHAAEALLARGDAVSAFGIALERIEALLQLRARDAPLENNELDDDVVIEKGA